MTHPDQAVVEVRQPSKPVQVVQASTLLQFDVGEVARPLLEVTQPPPARLLEVLVPGPAGPPGATSAGHRHVQHLPSATWTVIHNLGYAPAGILVYDDLGAQTVGEVVVSTGQATVLSFNEPIAGTADVS